MALVGRHAVATVAVISWKRQQSLDREEFTCTTCPPAETPRDGTEHSQQTCGAVARAAVTQLGRT